MVTIIKKFQPYKATVQIYDEDPPMSLPIGTIEFDRPRTCRECSIEMGQYPGPQMASEVVPDWSFTELDAIAMGIPFGVDLLDKMISVTMTSAPAPILSERIDFDALGAFDATVYSLVRTTSHLGEHYPSRPFSSAVLTIRFASFGKTRHKSTSLSISLTRGEYVALAVELKQPVVFTMAFAVEDMPAKVILEPSASLDEEWPD